MQGLRRTPIYRVLHRPQLLLGGERAPVLIIGIFAALALVTRIPVIMGVGALVWAAGMAGLRRLAKEDPQAIEIWWRQCRFQSYYPPRPRPHAKS